MALIVDPDDLTFEVVTLTATGTNMVSVITDTVPPTIQLTKTGALSDDGVTLQCLYSKLKEIWKDNATAVKFPFPMDTITPESFEFINDWRPQADATRNLFRLSGWAERDGGTIVREYAGVITLGNIDSTSKTVGDKAYYSFASDTSRTEFTYAGPVDEGVQIYGGPADGNFDKRSEVLTARIRILGKTFGQVTTTDIGVSTLTYIAYRFPLSEAADLKYSDLSPYTGMTITYAAAPQASNTFLTTDLAGGPYNFHVIINPNNNNALKTYAFIQTQLTTDGDIDDGAGNVNGYLADELAFYVGDTFKTKQIEGGTKGVALDADLLDSNDINSVVFTDDSGGERTFPFVAAGTISFSQTLVDDTDAIYRMFFTNDDAGDNAGNDYGTTSAILVDDNSGSDIAGTISAQPSISFTYDYDGNSQRGAGSIGTDVPITIVAIGLNNGQYVSTTGTITRSVGQSFSLVAALERNYNNPA